MGLVSLVCAAGLLICAAAAAAAYVQEQWVGDPPGGQSARPLSLWDGYSHGGSERVREVQRRLRRLGYSPGPVDGRFGPLTKRAVVRFERDEGLEPNGVAGPQALQRLDVRAALDRLTTSSLHSRSPSLQSAGAVPSRETRPAAAPAPASSEPVPAGPGHGVFVLILLLAMLAALLGILTFAGFLLARRTRSPEDHLAHATPGPALLSGPVSACDESRSGSAPDGSRGDRPRLGELLLEAHALSQRDLGAALDEQRRSGGRLGENME